VDGGIAHALTFGWVKVVVNGCQYYIMTYECSFVDGYASLILKLTPHVDEYMLTNDGVLSAVGMEWRKQLHSGREE